MNDIPPTVQEQLKPLFLKKDIYSGKLCENGKEIRRIQLELMKESKIPGDVLRRSQRLIEETRVGRGTRTTSAEQILDLRLDYLTAKLGALEREIDGVLTQEMLVTEPEKIEG